MTFSMIMLNSQQTKLANISPKWDPLDWREMASNIVFHHKVSILLMVKVLTIFRQ